MGGRAEAPLPKAQPSQGLLPAPQTLDWEGAKVEEPGEHTGVGGTYTAMDMLAADRGLTSATSLAFWRASFWLAASSSSCSS